MSRQHSVWGYFAFALLSLLLGGGLYWLSLGTALPDESSLVAVEGEIATISIIDDLSGEPTGLMTPLNSIHFTLRDNIAVFRYPSRWPGYSDLYERLSFKVRVLVIPAELQQHGPVTVYALEQTVPGNWPYPAVSITYVDIDHALNADKRTYRGPGIVLLMLAPLLIVVGWGVVQINRRSPREPKAD